MFPPTPHSPRNGNSSGRQTRIPGGQEGTQLILGGTPRGTFSLNEVCVGGMESPGRIRHSPGTHSEKDTRTHAHPSAQTCSQPHSLLSLFSITQFHFIYFLKYVFGVFFKNIFY